MKGAPWVSRHTGRPIRSDCCGSAGIPARRGRHARHARVRRATRPRPRASLADGAAMRSPTCRRSSSPATRWATTRAASCSCCRPWTPRARAASSSTSSAPSTRRACRSPPSRQPTEEELSTTSSGASARRCPAPGMIGVFDRSHYEDVLIARVRELAPPEEIERRYGAINEFEAELVGTGTTIIKVMLHISTEEQKERLPSGSSGPRSTGSTTRATSTSGSAGPQYQEAYQIVFDRTTDAARSVVRRAGGPQVVRAARGAAPAHRGARGDAASTGRPRRTTSRPRRRGSPRAEPTGAVSRRRPRRSGGTSSRSRRARRPGTESCDDAAAGIGRDGAVGRRPARSAARSPTRRRRRRRPSPPVRRSGRGRTASSSAISSSAASRRGARDGGRRMQRAARGRASSSRRRACPRGRSRGATGSAAAG